jgi:dephospho-CoA kinase
VLRVGLTGGIACGKTRVLLRLAAGGLATLDLDSVAHEVMAPGGSAYDDVVAEFGNGVVAPDGTIDRQALGTLVFHDPEARARLDALVHPRVRAEEAKRAARLEAEGHGILVSDAALLVEAGVHLRFDRLVVVHCPVEEQRRRLMARDGIPEAAAQARIDAQMPIAEKRRFAHLEVDTSESVEETDVAADELMATLHELAGREKPPGPAPRERMLGALVHSVPHGPRGLDPRALLELAIEEGGLEMSSLAGRLQPAGDDRWYRAARPGETAPWPEALAAPLAFLARSRGADEDWLAGAAASVARLTHAAPDAAAGACLAALAALAVASSGNLDCLGVGHDAWEERARVWGGGAGPAPRVRRSLEAAVAHPGDPRAAEAAASRDGAEPALASALVGMARGVAEDTADPALVALVERLSKLP